MIPQIFNRSNTEKMSLNQMILWINLLIKKCDPLVFSAVVEF